MNFKLKQYLGYAVVLSLILISTIMVAACSTPAPSTSTPPSPTVTSKTNIPTTTSPVPPSPTISPSPSPSTEAAIPSTPAPPATANVVKQWMTPPEMQIDPSKPYFATVNTSLGSFKIQLLAGESPRTVNNFVFLSQQGFYDGVIFHRIIQSFMIQTGDPTGTGEGVPGYKFNDELPPFHLYAPGIVAMANSGPNTNGSQFFICTGPDSDSLNRYPNYTQFGKVVEGMDVVQKIASVPVGPGNPGENSRPVNPPVINNIVISSQ